MDAPVYRSGNLKSVASIVLVAIMASGCAVVKAHQREHLAKRAMTADQEVGEVRFNEHARGSREGATGGAGSPGGGCGCN
jgi:hypothetical protein